MPGMPGPGDPETWPAFAGHPNDPRHPGDAECPDCDELLDEDGCCPECGWSVPEPDYEAIAEARAEALDGGWW